MDEYLKKNFEHMQSETERNAAQKRHILAAIEMELKRIIPTTTILNRHYTYPRLDKIQDRDTMDRIEDLLQARNYLLNQMFLCNQAEKERFKQINEQLLGLTRQMYARTANLYRAIHKSLKDGTFDDDCEIEGRLLFSHSGSESVLTLEEDKFYSSDFNRMIELIATLLNKKGLAKIESCSISNGINNMPDATDKELGLTDEFDDETSWAEGYLRRSELDDICICHAIHDICIHKPYSIPDLLRMNNFRVEAEVTFQHFASQTSE